MIAPNYHLEATEGERTLSRDERTALGIEIACHHAKFGAPMSCEQLADFLGISAEAVRQIEKRALKRLRLHHARGLRDELCEWTAGQRQHAPMRAPVGSAD